MGLKKKIIIDTDPGHDDALAMLLMLRSEEIDVRLITTVAGNSTVQNCTNNAYFIRSLSGKQNIAISSGAARPLRRHLLPAVVHGSSGLAGIASVPTVALNGKAVECIVRTVRSNPYEVTLLILGPQTNIAQAILSDQETMLKVKELVIMGGAFAVAGNQTPVAEFNIFSDPEAASIVADFPVPKTYIPLDVCNEIQVPLEEFLRIREQPLRETVCAMMKPYIQNLNKFELLTKGALMYDVLAAYHVLRPYKCEESRAVIGVNVEEGPALGRTVANDTITGILHPVSSMIVSSIPRQQFLDDFFSVINTGSTTSE